MVSTRSWIRTCGSPDQEYEQCTWLPASTADSAIMTAVSIAPVGCEMALGLIQVRLRINARRKRFRGDPDRDAHSRFEGSQLLKRLDLFQQSGRQRGELAERARTVAI